jgi:hypothetical protein
MVHFYPTSALLAFTLTLHPYFLRYGVHFFPPGGVPKRQHRFEAGRHHLLRFCHRERTFLRLAHWPRFPNQLAVGILAQSKQFNITGTPSYSSSVSSFSRSST